MVWPFKKSKILDLTEKNYNPTSMPRVSPQVTTEDYTDLTSNSTSLPSSGTPVGAPENALGFLGTMAGASSTPTTSAPTIASTGLGLTSNQHLKVKMEDIEYKIDNMMKKVGALLDRMDLTEKRLDRVDRR